MIYVYIYIYISYIFIIYIWYIYIYIIYIYTIYIYIYIIYIYTYHIYIYISYIYKCTYHIHTCKQLPFQLVSPALPKDLRATPSHQLPGLGVPIIIPENCRIYRIYRGIDWFHNC